MIQRKRLSLALWSTLARITPFAAFAEEQKEGRVEGSYAYKADGACWNITPKCACAEPLPCCIHLQLKMPQPFVQAVGEFCE